MSNPARSALRDRALKSADRACDGVVRRHGAHLDGLIAEAGSAIAGEDWPRANRKLRMIAGEAKLFGAPVAGALAGRLGDMIEAFPPHTAARAAGPLFDAVQLAAREKIAESCGEAAALMQRVDAVEEHLRK